MPPSAWRLIGLPCAPNLVDDVNTGVSERLGLARIVREQLMKAGVRLAAMLEADLGVN